MHYIIHAGVAHDKNPPGRGSGRYPFGYSSEKERKKKKKLAEKEVARKNEAARRAQQKAKAASEERKRFEERKEKILKGTSATEVLKIQDELTPKELERALSRIKLTSQLQDYSDKEINRTLKKIDKRMNNLKMINNWASIGIDSWNNIANVYNATDSGKSAPLRTIKKGGGDGGQSGKGKGKK